MGKLDISLRFGFCKRCLKYWNLQKGTKKISFFFVGVPLFSILLEIFSTLLTLHSLKCIFHVNIHIEKIVNVMFLENVSIWIVTSENINRKSTWFFGFLVGYINISDNFYKIKKFNLGPVFSIITTDLIFSEILGLLYINCRGCMQDKMVE